MIRTMATPRGSVLTPSSSSSEKMPTSSKGAVWNGSSSERSSVTGNIPWIIAGGLIG